MLLLYLYIDRPLPYLVPSHVGTLVNHVVSLPSTDGNERNLHGLVPDLLEVGGHLGLDLLVALLVVLDGLVVHLVAAHDHLFDPEGEGKEGVLAGLPVLGDARLEPSLGGVDAKNGNVGLGGTGDHVLDEITVSGGVNDGEGVLGRLKLPKSNVNGDSALTLGLEVVKDPGVLEGALAELGGLLLVLLDSTLVNSSALVDQVSGGGGLSGIDMANDHQTNVNFFLSHFVFGSGVLKFCKLWGSMGGWEGEGGSRITYLKSGASVGGR